MTSPALELTEQQRFSMLMRRSHRKVFNLAFRLVGNRPDAEDLTQEAFYRAYRSFHEYQGDRPFENWIFRIVTRLFLDFVRTKKRRISAVSYDAPYRGDGVDEPLDLQAPDSAPSPEESLMRSTVSEDLSAALGTLKPEQRLLVLMADVEQMPYDEIAQLAKVPVGTVRSRLHRAHRRLRTTLETRTAKRRECGCATCLCASA